MKTTFLIFALIIGSTFLVIGQDVIILNTKEKIEGKITEVDLNIVKYKKASNINGPVYSILKSDIFLVIYENGTQESFDIKAETQKTPNVPNVPSKPEAPSKQNTQSKNTPNIPPAVPILTIDQNSNSNSMDGMKTKGPELPNTVYPEEKNVASPTPLRSIDLEKMYVPTSKYKLRFANKEKLRINDKTIYNQYKSARTMKSIFGTVSAISTGIFILSLVNDLSGFDVDNTSATVIYPATYIFAGIGLFTSFLTKGPKRRIKRSYDDHNNDISRKIKSLSAITIQPSCKGVSIAFRF